MASLPQSFIASSSSSYYPSESLTRNVSVLGKEEKRASEYTNRDIFGLVPSQPEVESAATALQNFLKAISSSESGFNQQLKTLGYGDIKKSLSHGYGRVENAFRLLQTEPSIKRLVISLSSDKAVWDAVMNNEVVRQLRESFIDPGVNRRIPSCTEEQDVGTCVLRWIMDITKAQVTLLIQKFQQLMNEIFQPSEREKERVTEGSIDEMDDIIRSSLLLSIVILLIVVVARIHGA
ncbi:hypothetical protein GH714_019047 [Hevea brasiliensis]|uniref:Uncharacterized protein n=1 Tax=Hevea brasiliensis TaxID=3981 RepID=A0A6A6LTH0_HEVBR|nr:hypothetical protein GH714_019047 [Hevea brasiliensis]